MPMQPPTSAVSGKAVVTSFAYAGARANFHKWDANGAPYETTSVRSFWRTRRLTGENPSRPSPVTDRSVSHRPGSSRRNPLICCTRLSSRMQKRPP